MTRIARLLVAATVSLVGGASVGCGSDVTDSAGAGGQVQGGGGAGGEASGGGGAETAEAELVFVDASGDPIEQTRYGDFFSVRVEQLPANAEVTVRSAFWGDAGWATFEADDAGVVDTARDAPTDGTYDGVEPEGLIWSMETLSNDSDTTLDVHFSVELEGAPLTEAVMPRQWLDEGLVREVIEQDGLVGDLYRPEEVPEPLPALIVLGGSEGGLAYPSFRAVWLAGYGYVALGLAYFDEPGLPDDLHEIPLEYFETALGVLAARPDVDPTRIGVVGGSRGGELALMLAARFPQIRAVVAEVPSHVRWGAVSTPNASAWSQEGLPLPYLTDASGAEPIEESLPDGGYAFRLTPVFEAALDTADPANLAAATIAVEDSQASILMLAGEDDGVWPSCRMAEAAMDRLVAAGHAAAWRDEVHCFADSGHHAAMPGGSTMDSYASSGAGGFSLVLGGTPKGVAHAQRDGLTLLRAFLAENL